MDTHCASQKLKRTEMELANAEDTVQTLAKSLGQMTARMKSENSMRTTLFICLHDVVEAHRLVRPLEMRAALDRALIALQECR